MLFIGTLSNLAIHYSSQRTPNNSQGMQSVRKIIQQNKNKAVKKFIILSIVIFSVSCTVTRNGGNCPSNDKKFFFKHEGPDVHKKPFKKS